VDFKIVVMGASLGGLSALKVVLKALPKDYQLALAVVMHRGADQGGGLVRALQEYCVLSVVEVEDKQSILLGHVFLAPAGYHMLVEEDHFALSTEAPVKYARPSIDVLFESAADYYGDRAIGVILTGANEDGAQGIAAIKREGGLTVVQDPATAEAATMPKGAISGTKVDMILPLREIGPFLASIRRKSKYHRRP
jgi:two-component system, chemotaxis family, protein-glutamate methylesterase/glutaminase